MAVYFSPDGHTAVWAFQFSRWKVQEDSDLVPRLAQAYRQPESGEPRLVEWLQSQDVWAADRHLWKRAPGPVLTDFCPQEWDETLQPGIYHFRGDGEGGCWRYHYRPGCTPCLGCLWRNWFLIHQPELFQRLREWPDLRLRWPGERMPKIFGQADLPVGALDSVRDGKLRRGRVWKRPGCPCAPPQRSTSHWAWWSHPVAGPLGQVAETQTDGLWRVSARLSGIPSSGTATERRRARLAALGEAIERHAAYHPPEQTGATTRLWRLGRPGTRRFPSNQVWLGYEEGRGDRLSHGLACGPNLKTAVRAGASELLERDALVRWWREWSAGRDGDVRRHAEGLWSVPAAQGRAYLAAVSNPHGGAAWGSAAGPDAAARAQREARHNALVMTEQCPEAPSELRTFQDHASQAWHQQLFRWHELKAVPLSPEEPAAEVSWDGPCRFYYRKLPSHWADVLGWSVVRVLSPDLLGLPMDERRWPIDHPRWGGGEAPQHPHPFG